MLKAARDRVIIKVLEADDRTSGGLELPDSVKSQPLAEVVAVCDNWPELQAEPLNVGDIVVFAENTGSDINLDGTVYKIVHHKEVLIVI